MFALGIDGEGDIGALVPAGVRPDLGARVDIGDDEGVRIEVVLAGLESLVPHPDAADRYDRRIERLRILATGRRGAVHLLLDGAVDGLRRLQGAEVDFGIDIRLDDPDEAGADFLGVLLGDVPEVAVEAIFAGWQHRQLGPALAAIVQKRLGVEHRIGELGGNGSAKAWPGRSGAPSLATSTATLPGSTRSSMLLVSTL